MKIAHSTYLLLCGLYLPAITVALHDRVIVNDNPFSHMVYGSNGAVAVENERCSSAGVEVLKDGGNSVDAAIAAALCIGVINSFATGIGGGGFMLIRTSTGEYDFIDFREAAPGAATADMYTQNMTLSQVTGLAVGVPGEIRGFELAHKNYGKLPWSRIFQDAIEVAREGFQVNQLVRSRLESSENWIMKSPEWSEIFAPTGKIAEIGETIYRPALADTLEAIAENGADVFYEGPIAESIVNTVSQKNGGILTLDDMKSYTAISRPVVRTTYHDYKVFTTSAPTSGPILANILNTIEPYHFEQNKGEEQEDHRDALKMHRLVEAFKFGYAARTELGDPSFAKNKERQDEIVSKAWADEIRSMIHDNETFNPAYYKPLFQGNDPHGTMHLSVVDKDHGAVALTSTVNLIFGSRVMDAKTGVILNDQQDDFSTPGFSNAFGFSPSPNNFVAPHKRPLSSITPTIIEDKNGDLRLVVGGSGGSEIITATVNTIINKLDFDMDLYESVGAPRIHHQLMPNRVGIEQGFNKTVEKTLASFGHQIHRLGKNEIFSAVQSIYLHKNGTLNAASDPRKFGLAAAY